MCARKRESDLEYSETEDVGCYFTDDIPSDLGMGDDDVFYVGTGVQEDPVQIELIFFAVCILIMI